MSYAGIVEASGGAQSPIGSTLCGVCPTAAGTAAKVVTLAAFDTLVNNATIHVKFTYSNSVVYDPNDASTVITLNVNSTGAKPLYAYGTTQPGGTEATSWKANSVIPITYDESADAWRINGKNTELAIISSITNAVDAETALREAAVTDLAEQIAEAYSSSATYGIGDLCIYEDALYKCTTAISTAEAWTAEHWTAAIVDGTFARPMKFTDVLVAASSFVSDATYTDYPYRGAITLSGVTATMMPEVVLGVAEATSGAFAPLAAAYAGGVYLYADSVPDTVLKASIDKDAFLAEIGSGSGTKTFSYSSNTWNDDPEDYGITLIGTPINGDGISVVYNYSEETAIMTVDGHFVIPTIVCWR